MRFQLTAISFACATLLAGCGGGGSASSDAGMAQSISFPFPGGESVAVPPDIATITLTATASSGGPVTYVSNTPTVCTVSGATVSLLKAGECSVTASQAGGNGYAATSQSQLFVIPKRLQVLTFRNPGSQPLDATPLTLAATSSQDRTVTFASSTPSVCTVSGSSLQKLADGICTITASQDGGDIFMTPTPVVRNIPIGTALAPELKFLSGYKSTTLSNEDGKVDPAGGSSETGWWCDGWCEATLSPDGSSLSETFSFKKALPTDGRWWINWSQIEVFAPGVKNQPNEIIAAGVRIDAQSTLKFNLAQNQEWFDTGNNWVNVDFVLGHYHKKDNNDNCWVTLRGKIKPVTPAPTNYTVSLKDLTVSEKCDLTTPLDPWFELQDWSVFKIRFASDYGNNSVPSMTAPAPNYPTTVTLTGPITIQ